MPSAFRQQLIQLSQTVVKNAPKCANEESTKLFLVLPFIRLLGYDPSNPGEVVPEHHADFSDKYKNRVDFAILKDDVPIIAIECKGVGCALKEDRGQLRSYFNAAPTVKMAILTDGLRWEFFADSDEPNMMDEKAFLVIDLAEIAKSKLEDSDVSLLLGLRADVFVPESIGAEAKRKHLFNAILAQIDALSREPSEQFLRMFLQGAGVKYVRDKTLYSYSDLVVQAFKEFVNNQILQRLDLPAREADKLARLIHDGSWTNWRM